MSKPNQTFHLLESYVQVHHPHQSCHHFIRWILEIQTRQFVLHKVISNFHLQNDAIWYITEISFSHKIRLSHISASLKFRENKFNDKFYTIFNINFIPERSPLHKETKTPN